MPALVFFIGPMITNKITKQQPLAIKVNKEHQTKIQWFSYDGRPEALDAPSLKQYSSLYLTAKFRSKQGRNNVSKLVV